MLEDTTHGRVASAQCGCSMDDGPPEKGSRPEAFEYTSWTNLQSWRAYFKKALLAKLTDTKTFVLSISQPMQSAQSIFDIQFQCK